MLRLGVIGCGRVTTMFHLRAISDIRGVEVATVADVNEERMRVVANECNAKEYTDYHELLRDTGIDAVVINTPPKFHEEMVIEALGSGKHVLCEKPLSETVEGCMRIKEAQLESGLAMLPAHNYVFTPCLTRLIDLVDSGTVGGVRKLTLAFENNLKTYRSQTDFRITKSNGVVEDMLPHILSVSTPVAGSAVDVKELRWWREDYEVCDNMKTTLVTDRGVDLECSLS
ncbi:Gfo/Idh/MocA family oxidoreductase [Candidatus Bathyarchaeota archaeon]|nr:Gfo/Idh/MocA family oxidoreductase [Candidatus Bathyarchaeota archaeon]